MYEIVIDIETTGLDKLVDTPIQIAWYVLGKKRKPLEEGSFYINPGFPLTKSVISHTGITDEVLIQRGYWNGPGTRKYMDLIWRLQPCTLIGHNLIAFDHPVLHNWMERFYSGRFKQPPVTKLVDTMHLASIKWKTKKWLSLEDCGTRLEILFNKEQLGNAVADVRLTKEVYLGLLE